MEHTCILIKPDAVERGLCGKIISRFEEKNLHIAACKMVQMDDELLHQHYNHVAQEKFFTGLKEFMKSGPVLALVLYGADAVKIVRKISGKDFTDTDTIRGDFALSTQKNTIHSSDTIENANIEIRRFFSANEIIIK